MKRDVGIAIPSIPPRRDLLKRALRSVHDQTHPAEQLSVVIDFDRRGAGHTRNRAKNAIDCTWTAFLDDDDEMMPHHLQRLLDLAESAGSDVAFSWFEVVGGYDPFPDNRWVEFDPATPHSFGITALVRTEVVKAFDFGPPSTAYTAGNEDWHWWCTLAANGVTFANTPDITWRYHHDSDNTSGRPERWA